MNKNELWRPVKEYDSLYEVSNFGRIRSLPRNGTINAVRIIKLNPKKSGYINATLTKNNSKKTFRVHRLVAEAFIPNPKNKKQVNHIDGDKSNNSVDNLERATPSENIKHKFDSLGYKVTRHGMTPVICVETGERFDSIKAAERAYGKSYGAILHALKGKTSTAYGLHWNILPSDRHCRTLH